MLTRVKKYNRLPFIINKMERKKMIFLFLNEQKKKEKKKSYRHTSKEGDTRQRFCTKNIGNLLFKAQNTIQLKLKTVKL